MKHTDISILQRSAVEWLKALIAIPSFSGEEDRTGDLLAGILQDRGCAPRRKGNNIWALNHGYDPGKPTILLNSHHDTVRPVPGYTRDPFQPAVSDGRLFGLGSNDAGGALMALLAAFSYYAAEPDLACNLVFAGSAEEENSGKGGIEALIPELGPIAGAIVGEPTGMHLAVAERGLLVIDCISRGVSGHAARGEGINAIYAAMQDIAWFSSYAFDKVSDLLGPVRMSVTMIQAGSQHNVVPAECRFTADIRVNELYSFEEVLDIIDAHTTCELLPRSFRLRATRIADEHPLVRSGLALGRTSYGSPTCSDKALMPFPGLKMGPGDSARSHTADEYIYLSEIHDAVSLYIALLEPVLYPWRPGGIAFNSMLLP